MSGLSVEHRLALLEKAVANLIRVGVIQSVDYSPPVPRARVQIGNLLTAFLPLPAIRAGGDLATWLLETGEQVVVLAPGGRLEQAVISHALNSESAVQSSDDANLAKLMFKDGSIVQMNRQSGVLTLAPIDKVVINSDLELTGDFSHVGNTEHVGDTMQTGEVTHVGDTAQTGTHVASVDVIAGTVSLTGHTHDHDHTHPGSNTSPVNTDPPTP